MWGRLRRQVRAVVIFTAATGIFLTGQAVGGGAPHLPTVLMVVLATGAILIAVLPLYQRQDDQDTRSTQIFYHIDEQGERTRDAVYRSSSTLLRAIQDIRDGQAAVLELGRILGAQRSDDKD